MVSFSIQFILETIFSKNIFPWNIFFQKKHSTHTYLSWMKRTEFERPWKTTLNFTEKFSEVQFAHKLPTISVISFLIFIIRIYFDLKSENSICTKLKHIPFPYTYAYLLTCIRCLDVSEIIAKPIFIYPTLMPKHILWASWGRVATKIWFFKIIIFF